MSTTTSSVSIKIARRIPRLFSNSFNKNIFTLSFLIFGTRLKSKITWSACFEALCMRFLSVFSFTVSGLFISQVVPSIKKSGLSYHSPSALFFLSLLLAQGSELASRIPNLPNHQCGQGVRGRGERGEAARPYCATQRTVKPFTLWLLY